MERKQKIIIAVVIALAAVLTGLSINAIYERRSTVMTASSETTNVPPPSVSPDYDEMLSGGKININTADTALLDQLRGVGEVMAQRIVDYRNEHGSFKSIDEIMLVPGIGEKKFEDIQDQICVE